MLNNNVDTLTISSSLLILNPMATLPFQDCLMGILKDKTILYVTHQVEFLPAADLILVRREKHILSRILCSAKHE